MTFLVTSIIDSAGAGDEMVAVCHAVLAARVGSRRATIVRNDLFAVVFDAASAQVRQEGDYTALVFGDLIAAGCESAQDDLARFLLAVARGDAATGSFLAGCRGNFTAIALTPDGAGVRLASDCLATRPIFYATMDHGAVATSHLRFWRDLPIGNLAMDADAAAECAIFGTPLGVKTGLRGVCSLQAASLLAIDACDGPRVRPYWDWTALADADPDISAVAAQAHAAFTTGVAARLRRRGAGYCLLSGGMDSRVVAFMLAEAGAASTTVSFGLPDSFDRVVGDELARLLPGRHISRTIDAFRFDSLGGPIAIATSLIDGDAGRASGRAAVWTGDGGSCAFGGVFLDEGIIAASADPAACADAFVRFNRCGLSRLLCRTAVGMAWNAERLIEAEMRSCVAKRDDLMPYLFLLLNNQKRHNWDAFEQIAEMDLEIVTPFFDFEFLRTVSRSPVLNIMFHRLYNEFFTFLPEPARSVPWQTYVGHLPCPLPPFPGCTSAWNRPKRFLAGDARAYAWRAARVALAASRRARALRPFSGARMALVGLAGTILPGRTRHLIQQSEAILACLPPAGCHPGRAWRIRHSADAMA